MWIRFSYFPSIPCSTNHRQTKSILQCQLPKRIQAYMVVSFWKQYCVFIPVKWKHFFLMNSEFLVLVVIAQVIHLFITSWKYPWIKFDYESVLV